MVTAYPYLVKTAINIG